MKPWKSPRSYAEPENPERSRDENQKRWSQLWLVGTCKTHEPIGLLADKDDWACVKDDYEVYVTPREIIIDIKKDKGGRKR